MAYDDAYGGYSSYYTTEQQYGAGPSQPMARHYSQSSDGTGTSLSPTTPAPLDDVAWAAQEDVFDEYGTYSPQYSPQFTPQYGDQSMVTHTGESWPSQSHDCHEQAPEYANYYTSGDYAASAVSQAGVKTESGLAATPRDRSARGADNGVYVCLYLNCSVKPFKRKADLERHIKRVHMPPEENKAYYCDYQPCNRSKEPFYRFDHTRDHFRDFHREDLIRKNGEKDKWFDDRVAAKKWWRCTKCLARVKVNDGWQCTTKDCTGRCESKRRALRGYD